MEKTFFSHGHNPGKSSVARFGVDTAVRKRFFRPLDPPIMGVVCIGGHPQNPRQESASADCTSFRTTRTLAGEMVSCLFPALIANNRFVWLQATVIDNQNKKRKEYI